jgi:prophage regulatory protein
MNTLALASPAPQTRFLREGEVRHVTGLSRTQRWRLEREGRFPSRVALSERAFGWVEIEIREWVAARVLERDRTRRPVSAA